MNKDIINKGISNKDVKNKTMMKRVKQSNVQLTRIMLNVLMSTAVISSIFGLTSAYADTLIGTDLEIGVWSPDYDAGSITGSPSGDKRAVFASATIEHPVPLMPNLKLSLSKVNSDAYQYTKIDYTGYYEILDNDMISIDVGLGVSQFQNGKYLSQSFSGLIPHTYVDAEVALPLLNTTLYTDIHYLSYDGNQITDAIAGLRYDFDLIAVDLGLKAGYRVQKFDAEDFDNISFDVTTDGYFVGLQADF